MRKMLALLLLVTLITAGLAQAQDTAPTSETWWNDRVFYEIFVRSFYDSDGDGIGDIQGVIQKLDYLNDGDPTTTTDLGVTGIWLMPILESPSYHGYDVVDYRQIEQDYGTLEDFQELIAAAHERGIVVVMDLVLNHTSREHPWFEEAAQNGDSEYDDWYIWSEDNPGYPGPWGQGVWHRAPEGYYYGVFWEGMPDLNYENPDVTAEMLEVTRYWLEDVGVDGFRLDAIKHMIENGRTQENTPATLDWMAQYQDFINSINPNAFTVGEVWSSTDQVLKYIGARVDVAFEFDLAGAMTQAARVGVDSSLTRTYEGILNHFPPGQYATFLTNHDQNRVMSLMRGDLGKGKIAASLLLTTPGVPFLYYGEEIGMEGQKPDERIRTPMQWDATENTAGFTTGRPWETLNTITAENNVAVMNEDEDSLLAHYRSLIHLRNENETLRRGEMLLVDSGFNRMFSFIRQTEDETLLVIINLSDNEIPAEDYALSIETGVLGADSAALLFGEGEVTAPTLTNGGFADYDPLAVIAPNATYIIKLK